MGVPATGPLAQLSLPPGFRFYPTDEELLVQYLCRKVAGHHFILEIIGDIDLYKFDPWDLPSKALFGEKEWYFFSPRDRKYPNGSRPNRVAGTGYWKATGTDKVITTEGRRVGIKKALVFYVGKAPKGTKTNWIMHEYRLHETRYRNSGSSKLDDWVLCRIYKKNSSSSQEPLAILSAAASSGKEHSHASSSSSSSLDDMLEALPGMDGQFFAHAHPRMHTVKAEHQPQGQKPYLQSCLESSSFNWAALAGSSSGGPEPSYAQPQPHLANYANNDASYALAVPPPPMPTAAATQLWRQAFNPMADQEVQSGLRGGARQQLGAFHQGSGLLEQAPTTSIDPLLYRYPASQSTGFDYRQ